MTVIKAQKIPQKESEIDDEIMRFCYYYPQYTYAVARKMSFHRVQKMLKVAKQEQYRMLYNLTRAIAAPHTKKGAMVNKLLSEFRQIIEK